MKTTVFVMLVLSVSAWSTVIESSDHYTDALAVDAFISLAGYTSSSFGVEIAWLDDYGESYFIYWFADRWDDDYDDFTKVRVSIAAVAIVSKSTTWSSEYLAVQFTDKIVLTTTEEARWFFNNIAYLTESEISMWFVNHLAIIDY